MGKQTNITGEVFRLIRLSHDLSIAEVANKTHISKSYLSEIESGVKIPSPQKIEEFCAGLNIDPSVVTYLIAENSRNGLSFQKKLLNVLRAIANI